MTDSPATATGTATARTSGSDALRAAAVVAALVIVLGVNAAANSLPIGGRSTGEISDMFSTAFTPAGYTFAIWGVIYLTLIGFAVFQALPSMRTEPVLRRIGWPFVLNGALNALWIVAWHNLRIGLSVVLMLGILGSLIYIYRTVWSADLPDRRLSYWTLRLPFSLYLAWITVATIANVTILLVDLGWDGGGIAPAVWSAMLLAVGLAIALWMAVPRRDVAYMAVITWAYVGVAVGQADLPIVRRTAVLLAGVAIGAAAAMVWRSGLGRGGGVDTVDADS